VEYVNSHIDGSKLLCLQDPQMSMWPDSLWLQLMEIGKKCTAQLRKNRPSMSSVSVTKCRLNDSESLASTEKFQSGLSNFLYKPGFN